MSHDRGGRKPSPEREDQMSKQPQGLRDYWRGYHAAEARIADYGFASTKDALRYGACGNGSIAYYSGFCAYLNKVGRKVRR